MAKILIWIYRFQAPNSCILRNWFHTAPVSLLGYWIWDHSREFRLLEQHTNLEHPSVRF